MTDSQNDLSAGNLPPAQSKLLEFEISSAKDTLYFKRGIFYSSLILIVTFYVALIYYIFFHACRDITHEQLILAAFIGAIPTIVLLAISRRVFANKDDKDKPDSVSIWQELGRQLLDVLKEWVHKKP